jgi:hypothetical protein
MMILLNQSSQSKEVLDDGPRIKLNDTSTGLEEGNEESIWPDALYKLRGIGFGFIFKLDIRIHMYVLYTRDLCYFCFCLVFSLSNFTIGSRASMF